MHNYIFILFLFSFSYSSNIENSLIENHIDFMDDYNSNPEEMEDYYNQNLLPTLMSLIIPGSGQLKKKQWGKGIAFLSSELILLNYRDKYNDEGDYYVNQYKEFASENWSFAKWIKDYYSFIDDIQLEESYGVYQAFINNDLCDNYIPGSNDNYYSSNGYMGYCAPWQQAHYIEYTNTGNLQGLSGQTDDGLVTDNLFSTFCDESDYYEGCTISEENLLYINQNFEITKDHHFYEGIGKYNLFFAGWNDSHECFDVENGNLHVSYTCRWIENVNGYDIALSKYKQYYQDELRAKSNEKYDLAENALTLMFVNHAVSMMESFLSDYLNYNKDKTSISPLYNINNKKIKGVDISFSW